MDAQAFLDPFVRLLEAECPPATVRAIEAGASPAPLWQALSASGYLDALVPETAQGAGLSLPLVAPILMALGAYAVPVPVADTLVARALIARAGCALPDGPIVLVSQPSQWPVVSGQWADWALIEREGQLMLHPIVTAQPCGVFADVSARLTFEEAGVPFGPAPKGGLMALSAILRAAEIAGAADRLLAQTTAYANDRVQFGKPIGKQQAIQQQLAVMAQHSIAARLAAQTGCAAGLDGDVLRAAIAKLGASAAAVEVAAIAHAVHGAMGISAEYDLNLLTRRLNAWRLASGAESYWAGLLGKMRLGAAQSSLDFIRA